jgi:hypothetical protein
VIGIKAMGITRTLRLEECLRLGLCAKVAAIPVSHQRFAMSDGRLSATSNDSKSSKQYDAQPKPQKPITISGSSPKQSSLCHSAILGPES